MQFTIAIEPGTDTTAWGVEVPDLPGCFSAGDTEAEAYANVIEAIGIHCRVVIADGGPIPAARPIAEHQADPEYLGWTWDTVEVQI